MYHLVSQSIAYNVEGDLVEVGCYEGQSAVLITKVMHNSTKKLHVYESFEGLPAARTEDGNSYKKGPGDVREDVLIENFRMHCLELPNIHKGWFNDNAPRQSTEKDMLCAFRWPPI
jgi:O-methyltransferase